MEHGKIECKNVAYLGDLALSTLVLASDNQDFVVFSDGHGSGLDVLVGVL